MNLNKIPLVAVEMNANDIHIYVGKSKVRLARVRGFVRLIGGDLAVRFLPVSVDGGAIVDGLEVLEAMCVIKNAIVGRDVNGKIVDVEKTVIFELIET